MDKKNKSRHYIVFLAVCLIAAAVILRLVFGLIEHTVSKTENFPEENSTTVLSRTEGQLYYNNAWYVRREPLETLLVLGIDKRLDGSEDRADSEQVDFLALLIMEKETESFRILHLNRDTMAEIPMTDEAGIVSGTFRGQLALAHVYGTHAEGRCRNAVRAVENLLYGTEIDHYISLTMDAVAILNDSVGGVTLPLLQDFGDLGQQDDVVTLNGEQALTYVRARSELEDSSNLRRMERQRQYIGALFRTFSETASHNEEKTFETMLEINEYMVSDYSAAQLSELIGTLRGYTFDGILTLAGEAVQGAEFMEFHIDETAARQTVVDLFYQPCE